MANALRFRQAEVPRQTGERARLKVIQGPDQGCTYVLTGVAACIGRGEDCDIVITDLKASRKHANFSYEQGAWWVKDLGSANGIGHLGRQVRGAKLGSSDHVTVGETLLEFIQADMGTRLLVAPPKEAVQVRTEQAAFDAQRSRVRSLGRSRPVVATASASPGFQASTGKMVIPLVLVIGALAFYSNEESKEKPKKKESAKQAEASTPNRDLASYMESIQDGPEASKSAEMFFRAGFREFRERNYLRAKLNFENVLQVSPGHKMAQVYLSKSVQGIEAEVLFHLEHGKKGLSAGKLRASRGHFEAVLRLLYRDPTNPRFLEAKEQIEHVERQASGEEASS